MLWIKSFHILFVMAWMAGLFYLPRIFVHYVEGRLAGEEVSRLVIMARKLFAFMTVMAALALGTGFWLLMYGFNGGWLHTKLALVFLLLVYQLVCLRVLRKMQGLQEIGRPLHLRIFNEAALLIVLPIIILVVMKPF